MGGAAARIEVTQYADRTSHRVTTRLRGLVPNRGYGGSFGLGGDVNRLSASG
ncbi:hypothetical protein SMICM304S_04670 [Streptomyces microflavus]